MADDYDNDLFRREMTGVAPLGDNDRVQATPRREPTLAQRLRRASAIARPNHDPNPLTVPERVPQAGPYDIVGVKKNGVQEGVYRKLRLGKYDPRARLDLHRVRLMDARDRVYLFIHEAQRNGQRTVMINHGKGEHSERPGLLKSYVVHWLSEFDQVLAFHSAPANQGGAGVTLALLRKSTGASQKTREFFHERSRAQR